MSERQVIVTYNGYNNLDFVLTLPSSTEPCLFVLNLRSTLDDFRAMIIAEDNLIQKISFMSEDGKCRIAYCTSLESIETRKFRMRINQTEYRVGLPKETQFTSTDVVGQRKLSMCLREDLEIQKMREELQVIEQRKLSMCLREDLELQKMREEIQVIKQRTLSMCLREDLEIQKMREELQVIKQRTLSMCLREDLEIQKLKENLQVAEQIESSICLGEDLEIQKLREELQVLNQIKTITCLGKDLEIKKLKKLREELQVFNQIKTSTCLGKDLEIQKLREELQVFNQIKTSTCLTPEYLGGLKQRLLHFKSDGHLDDLMRSCSMNCNMQLDYLKHEIDVFTAAQL